ncbi:hypothetical protein V8B97DRAFT_913968 [Scleroderma yunnanense]
MESNTIVTVHDFATDGAGTSTSRFEKGRALVFELRSDANWVTPVRSMSESSFRVMHRRLYQYNAEPPLIKSGIQWASIESLREWGVLPSPESDECISLQRLDEFESTDFHAVAGPCDTSSHELLRIRNRSDEIPSCQRSSKRALQSEPLCPQLVKRPQLVTSSIVNSIPQPHFMPTCSTKVPVLDTAIFPHFSKGHPQPVPPYTTSSVSELLRSEYRRGAWLIPIRGQVPLEHASLAVIAQSPQDMALVSDLVHLASHKIIWTREILIDFWNFLIKLQQAANLGPISISLHAAPPDSIFTADTASDPTEESANNPYYQLHRHYSKSRTTIGSSFPRDNFEPYVYRAQLEALDYIKIYHNVPYSLSLRSVLDAYQYQPGDTDTSGALTIGDPGKSRVLKGARLAFMDERSKAAFLM